MPVRLTTRATLFAACLLVACEGLFEPEGDGDAELIAFLNHPVDATDPNAVDVFTMRPNGSRVRQRTTGMRAIGPAWSKDGQQLAFMNEKPGSEGIWVMDYDGTQLRQLTVAPYNSVPTWSSDGSEIAFANRDTIFVVPSAGGTPEPLFVCPDGCSFLDWSADGSRIVYVGRPDGTNPLVFVINVADPEQLPLASGYAYEHHPTWTPDGSKVLFTGIPGASAAHLYVATPGAGDPVAVTDLAEAPGYSHMSSDGTRLVFFLGTGFEDGIYVMAVATGEPQLILAIPAPLSWVPFTRWRPAAGGT